MVTVCYAERAIYEIPDADLSADRIRKVIREVERRLLRSEEGSARPTLSIPHLLAGESSAYYHGYVLALMGVQQTREFFLKRDGHLMDNPRIGPDLREHYWKPGNSRRFPDFIESLTGTPLSANALAKSVNRTPDEAVAEAKKRFERGASVPSHTAPIRLGAHVRVVHGHKVVTSASEQAGGEGFASACADFRTWIKAGV
ncbi:MAG: hypothetical protein HC813_02970 [Planctomycetes bacterium]|nr:hypothetical protein [Planctomycetota bacterium]